MKVKSILCVLALACGVSAFGQTVENAAQYLRAYPVGASVLTFRTGTDISQCGIPVVVPSWGMDVAWNSKDNVTRGWNYIGEALTIGRVSFQPSDLVDSNGQLSSAQQRTLQSRLNNIAVSGVKDIILNCDHEVLCNEEAFPNCAQNYANYYGKPEEWHRVIKASVEYCRAKGFNVIAISPFNEPDYTPWNEGTQAHFKAICKLISEDPDLAGIRISAGNTLNSDKASSWYEYMKPYVTEGNTHWLAGSFANYAGFFEKVSKDGNHGTADEMHNVAEAFIGLHYGMKSGVWWGFEGAARGEFCKAAYYGKEIGYAENRPAQSAATVYKRDNGRIDAFLGSSERDARDSEYEFYATDRPVYYDGEGPFFNFKMKLPGGTGYQKDQVNGERMIQIQYGEDVPSEAVREGEFVIMSVAKSTVLGLSNGNYSNGTTINLASYTANSTKDYQVWKITPVSDRQGSDFSYSFIETAKAGTNLRFDVLNWSTSEGGTICAYNGNGGSNEQWLFEYAGDNNWYIRSRHSGLYLEAGSSSVTQKFFTGEKAQKWRFIPAGTRREFTAPKAPEGLTATPQSASVLLKWNANTDSDLLAYEVLRAEAKDDAETLEWDMIGRMVKGTEFLDNMLSCGTTYVYKVKAIDVARNRSAASETVTAKTSSARTLIAHYKFNQDLEDVTENKLTAQSCNDAVFSTSLGVKEGSHFVKLNSSTKDYLLLPRSVADNEELTIAGWVYNLSSSKSWTRIFDFGNGTDQYMFLTPSNGSEMRFVMKNGGEEQILSAGKLGAGSHHVAVTIGKDAVALYLDGNKVAESTAFTISPKDIHAVMNYVGRSQFAGDEMFSGYIDDLRFYNYPLTAEDVQALYEGREVSAIEQVQSTEYKVQSTDIYDLSGRRVTSPQQNGIYFQNGKKVVIR